MVSFVGCKFITGVGFFTKCDKPFDFTECACIMAWTFVVCSLCMISLFSFVDFVDCCWAPAKVVVVTCLSSSASSADTRQWFSLWVFCKHQVSWITPFGKFLWVWWIAVEHRDSQSLEIELGLDWMLLMTMQTGFDQSLENLKQRLTVICLICWLLEFSYSALALSQCSCLICVGIFWVMRPACCKACKCCEQILSSGVFLFVSVIVVSSDGLLWMSEGIALKWALVWQISCWCTAEGHGWCHCFAFHPLQISIVWCQSLATVRLGHSWGQPTARVDLCCSKGSHQGMLLSDNCHKTAQNCYPQTCPWAQCDLASECRWNVPASVAALLTQLWPASTLMPSVVLQGDILQVLCRKGRTSVWVSGNYAFPSADQIRSLSKCGKKFSDLTNIVGIFSASLVSFFLTYLLAVTWCFTTSKSGPYG